MSRKQSEGILENSRHLGNMLIRQSVKNIGTYVVSTLDASRTFKHYRVEEVSKNGSEVYVVKLKNAEPCFKSLEDLMKYFVSESQGTYQSNDDENTHATGSNDEDIYSTQIYLLTTKEKHGKPPVEIDFSWQVSAIITNKGNKMEVCGCEIIIPQGAVSRTFSKICMFSLYFGKALNLDQNTLAVTPTLQCSPSLEFNKPITIKLPTCYTQTRPGVTATVTAISSLDGTTWKNLTEIKHNKEQVITFQTDSFG
ncbi:uncharacterized protein LOC143447291 [Clavelina lepadiformis]|uniref:uncharacterized protein LOC143447291 n=1 Tax=Clavelina lepadiformis TaxID=159417 RepID=UPI0040434CD3